MDTLIRELKQNFVIRVAVTNVLVIFFVAAVVLFVIRPAVGNIIATRRKVKEYKELSAQLDAKMKKLYRLSSEIQSQDALLQRLNFIFPYDYNYSFLLIHLQDLAERVGVKLVNVAFSENINSKIERNFKEQGITAVSPVTFNVTLEGDYYTMIYFVKYLEESIFMPQVVSVSYEVERESNKVKRTYTVTFVVFRAHQVISFKDMYALD